MLLLAKTLTSVKRRLAKPLYSAINLSTYYRNSTRISRMNKLKKIDIQSLSQAERILLAEELWDSVAANQDDLEVTDSQKKIIEERLALYEASPDEGTSWEEVKKEMK